MFTNKYLLKTYKLKNLIRYNHKTKITCENVSEHSYFVTLFTLKLCDELKLDDSTKLKCITKALLHDTPETEINDITYDVKVNNPDLTHILNILENKFYKHYYPHYADLMKDNNTVVDSVVKIADLYSVLQFTLNEIMLGNKSKEMHEIYEEAKTRIIKLEEELKKCL